MRRDKPGFDELEPPVVVTTPIDGLTDEEWARRRERRERRARFVAGIVCGLVVGSLAVLRLSPSAPHYVLGSWLVMGGSMLLFVTLLVRGKDERLPHYAHWVLVPEWKIVESLPLWAIAIVALTAIAALALVASLVVIGYFPFRFR